VVTYNALVAQERLTARGLSEMLGGRLRRQEKKKEKYMVYMLFFRHLHRFQYAYTSFID
jgi:hypothetical protein